MKDTWIGLPRALCPEACAPRYDALSGGSEDGYAVLEFQRTYVFGQKIRNARLRVSADTAYRLYCNGKSVATGPASAGGDFLRNGKPLEWHYADALTVTPDGDELSFFARVQSIPLQICEFSKGRCGFMLTAEILFEDGGTEYVTTDGTWLVRRSAAHTAPRRYDGTLVSENFVFADEIEDIWNAETAPIPQRTEKLLVGEAIILAPGEERTVEISFDKIYAGFAYLKADVRGVLRAELAFRELENEKKRFLESAVLAESGEYVGFYLYSAGTVTARLKNESRETARVTVGLLTAHYPVEIDAETATDDSELNAVLSVCKHSLKYCRQTLHLDSPRHCEPLACTGDYYIETLMTAFSFGDMRLAEFDVLRTAELLRHNDGRMFHTTYSLIWVRMLWDTYMLGGNFDMLLRSRDALDLLLARFESYIGENGLIEEPPDYMFVDWIYIDGISLHHPPKALGQSVLNMLYFMALNYAHRIYARIGENAASERCGKSAEVLRRAINTYLFDAEKEMYFEGLNTPSTASLIRSMHPQNVGKRYYLKQSNIMAAYTSVCDGETARTLLDKIMSNEIEGDVQPYFMHYLFEAIYTHGLREKYTLKLAERWKPSVKACPKGLAEGFTPPEPTYSFDHSHAWGGTPLYSVPKAMLGLSVDEPALRKITLKPSLLGLKYARVELPTPRGTVVCEMKEGEPPHVSAPDGVEVTVLV